MIALAVEAADPLRYEAPTLACPRGDLIGLSTRHSAILDGLRGALADDLPLDIVAGEMPTDAPWSDGGLPLVLADGAATLALPAGAAVLNASPVPTLLRPGRVLARPRRYVLATQVAMHPTGASGPRCGDDAAFTPLMPSAIGPNVGFFTPFQDPDTPDATWYGINTTVVTAEQLEGAGRGRCLEVVRERMLAAGRSIDLEPVDPDGTLAEAAVPVTTQSGRETQRTFDDALPVIDVHRGFSPGAPAINVDGMLSAAVGAEAFAGAWLASDRGAAAGARHALEASDAALRGLRLRNRGTEWFFFSAPEGLRRAMIRATPAAGMRLYCDDFATLGSAPRGGAARADV